MPTELDKYLTDRLILESEKRCTELTEMARRYSPDVRTSIRSAYFTTGAQVTFGMLHDPSGDELAFEVALTTRESNIWCEVAMFVGQATRIAIAASYWHDGYPTAEEVAAVIDDAFSFLAPRAERAFQQLIQQ